MHMTEPALKPMTFFLQRVLKNHVKGKIWEMVSMGLNITPPHLGRTASPSPGVDSTSPAGTHAPTHAHRRHHINVSASLILDVLILVL